MRGVSRLAVVLAFVVGGCGSQSASVTPSPTPTTPSIQHGTITVAGLVRTYRLFHPASFDAQHPVALVLLLHGCASSGDRFASSTRFDRQAEAGGFVAAYPDALANFGPGFDHCWNEYLDPAKADDLAFISALIDRLATDLPIDKARIFVAGLQSGGHMSHTLACAMGNRIAGIASVSGGMPIDEQKASMRCPDTRLAKPISLLEMHGTADDFIPYEGGGPLNAPATVDIVKYWAMIDGCSGDPSVSQSGVTRTMLWKQCAGGAVVRLDTVTGGHNEWFAQPNASAAVANWFFNSTQ